MLFVPSATNPFLVQIVKPEAGRGNLSYRRGQAALPNIDGLSLVKPPYSRVTAYDLNRGTIAWQIPMGDGPRIPPAASRI